MNLSGCTNDGHFLLKLKQLAYGLTKEKLKKMKTTLFFTNCMCRCFDHEKLEILFLIAVLVLIIVLWYISLCFDLWFSTQFKYDFVGASRFLHTMKQVSSLFSYILIIRKSSFCQNLVGGHWSTTPNFYCVVIHSSTKLESAVCFS